MNFLQYLRATESNSGRSGPTLSGKPVTFAQLAERGYYNVDAIQRSADFERTLNEARRLTDRAMTGDRWAALRFQEAMSMSDFPTYFNIILDRSILANYAETPYTWSSYCKRATIRDFRQSRIYRFDRGASVLDGPILPNAYGASGSGPTGLEQLTEYPQRKRVESNYSDQLYKFGARMDYAWEVMINDDLDALKDTPALFGRAARRTEEKRATELFVSSTGPNSTFFSIANNNVLQAAVNAVVTTPNAPLSITSLAWAMIIMSSQRDLDGEPISIESAVLVVPPSLDITARNILNALNIWMNDQGGTVDANGESLQRLFTRNWAAGRVQPVVNYYLPIVNTTSGTTAWYLFANPASGRPALQQSFLAGHETPEMFMKSPNAIPVGQTTNIPGMGQSNPMDGDFDTDSIMYKIRHVLGGTLLDPIMAVASDGTGR